MSAISRSSFAPSAFSSVKRFFEAFAFCAELVLRNRYILYLHIEILSGRQGVSIRLISSCVTTTEKPSKVWRKEYAQWHAPPSYHTNCADEGKRNVFMPSSRYCEMDARKSILSISMRPGTRGDEELWILEAPRYNSYLMICQSPVFSRNAGLLAVFYPCGMGEG